MSFSQLKGWPRLRAWVHLLVATAAHPQSQFTSATVAKKSDGAETFVLPALASDMALARLADLVTLRDQGLCEPLPLYCETSYRYASAVRTGRGDPVVMAEKAWTTGFGDFPKEDQDAEHVLVLGNHVSFEQIMADARFASLAHRLWDPILDEIGRA